MTNPLPSNNAGLNDGIDPDAHRFGDQGTRTYGDVAADGTTTVGVEKSVFKGKQVGTSMTREVKLSPAVGLALMAVLAIVAFLVWFLIFR